MICHNCGKVISFEKIITPDGRGYHLECWSSDDYLPTPKQLENMKYLFDSVTEAEKHPLEDK